MIKIGAFIEFNEQINKKVLKYKKLVKTNFGKQIYLDHPIHLTLFTLKIDKLSNLKRIYKNNLDKTKKSIKINLTSPGIFFNDPLTQGHTLYYKIKKSKRLKDLQMKHLIKINKNIKIFKKDLNFIKSPLLRKIYKKYGFPFAGSIWIPHTTIASIKNIKKNDLFIKKFINTKINLECVVRKINFYKISKDKHKFLFSTGNI